MGGIHSLGKSAMLASAANRRAHVRGKRRGDSLSNIPAKRNIRDSGAHLTISGAPAGTTLNRRAANTAQIMERIKMLPVHGPRRCTLAVGKGYAMGLYGVDATPLNCSSLRRLQGRTADAMVGRHQTMRCPEVALAISGKGGVEVKSHHHLATDTHVAKSLAPQTGMARAHIQDDPPHSGSVRRQPRTAAKAMGTKPQL